MTEPSPDELYTHPEPSIINLTARYGIAPTPGTGVTDDDILSVREAQQEMMPEIVRYWKRTLTRDIRGGQTYTFTEAPETTIGRIGAVKDDQQIAFADQMRGKATARLTVPYGTPIDENDRVEVSHTNPDSSVTNLGTYIIVANLSRSSYSTAARYLIEEV